MVNRPHLASGVLPGLGVTHASILAAYTCAQSKRAKHTMQMPETDGRSCTECVYVYQSGMCFLNCTIINDMRRTHDLS